MQNASRVLAVAIAVLCLCLIMGCEHNENSNSVNRIDLTVVGAKIAEYSNVSVENVKLIEIQYVNNGEWSVLYKIYANNTLEPVGGLGYAVDVRINQSDDYIVDFIRW